MDFTAEQIKLIEDIDLKVKAILKKGGDEKFIIREMFEYMEELKPIILASDKKILQEYLDKYDGFYFYLKTLEKIAAGLSKAN